MQYHFNVEVVIVVFAIRAPLNSHVLLVVVEHLIEFKARFELIRLGRHRVHRRGVLLVLLYFLETQMLRDLSQRGLLNSSELSLAIR